MSVQGICQKCDDKTKVTSKYGFALCEQCEKKLLKSVEADKKVVKTSKPKTKAEKKEVQKKEKKVARKIAKAVKREHSKTIIYIAGSAKSVEANGKKITKKIKVVETRKALKLARIEKLKLNILKAEDRIKVYEDRLVKYSTQMHPANFISQEQLKQFKIESYGITKDGGDRMKVKGEWFIRPPTLTGETVKLAKQLGKVKEKKLTRKITQKIESNN